MSSGLVSSSGLSHVRVRAPRAPRQVRRRAGIRHGGSLRTAVHAEAQGQYTVSVALPMGILFEEVEGYIFVGGVKPGSNAAKVKKIGTGDALLGYTDRRGRTQSTTGQSLDDVLDELVECQGSATLVFASAEDMRDGEVGGGGGARDGPEAVTLVVAEKGGLLGTKKRTLGAARRGPYDYGTLFDALVAADVEVFRESDKAKSCGGAGTCGTCRVRVASGSDALDAMGSFEAKCMKNQAKGDGGMRLACQAGITGRSLDPGVAAPTISISVRPDP